MIYECMKSYKLSYSEENENIINYNRFTVDADDISYISTEDFQIQGIKTLFKYCIEKDIKFKIYRLPFIVDGHKYQTLSDLNSVVCSKKGPKIYINQHNTCFKIYSDIFLYDISVSLLQLDIINQTYGSLSDLKNIYLINNCKKQFNEFLLYQKLREI